MKYTFVLFLLFALKAEAQITFEHTYTNPVYYDQVGIVHLSAAGYKYVYSDTDQVILYNLNHSVYTTISIPVQSPGIVSCRVTWISDQLFNTNPNDVEYALSYLDNSGLGHIRIYDQAGTLLFGRDSFHLYGNFGPGQNSTGVVHTAGGVKLLIVNQLSRETSAYSLPGVLPCSMCDGGVISGIQPQPSSPTENQQQLQNPYPNPTSSTTTIPYTLPDGSSAGTIVIYDAAGREVKRYGVSNAFTTLELSTADLAEGTYSYSLEAGGMILPGKKFVVVK